MWKVIINILIKHRMLDYLYGIETPLNKCIP